MEELDKYRGQEIVENLAYFESADKERGQAAADLIIPVLRYWYVALITFVVICVIATPVILFKIKPIHTTVGAIEVKPVSVDILTGEADQGEISNYQAYMNTQAKVITSNRVLERVADELKNKNLEFFKNAPDPMPVLKKALVYGIIEIIPSRQTQWIEITVKNRNPKEAEIIVNAFINSYMAIVGSYTTQKENQQLAQLTEARSVLGEKLDRQRQLINKLASEYGTDSLEGRQNVKLATLAAMQAELTNLEIRRMNLKTQIQLLEKTQSAVIPTAEMMRMRNEFISNDPFMLQLTQKIVEAKQRFIESKQHFTETNPALKQQEELIVMLEQSLDERQKEVGEKFDKTMADEVDRSKEYRLAQMKSEFDSTEALIESYQEKLNKEDLDAIRLGQLQWRIQDLKEQMAINKEEYDRYGKRISELELELKRPGLISVADYASTGPSEDKRIKLLVAMLIGALACGTALAFMIGKIDRSLYTPKDVTKRIGVRIIGTTTSSGAVEKEFLPKQLADDYQTIIANMGLFNGERIPRKLVVTSAGIRDGKTTSSINLATSLAKAGKKVLLIDGDLRKPDVRRMLHLPKGLKGIQDLAFGEKLQDVIHPVLSSGFDVLPAESKNISDVFGLLSLPYFAQCIKEAEGKYDHIIIDTPPVLAFPDALVWAKMSDAVILASFAGRTADQDLKETLDRLRQAGIRVIGTILNSVSANSGYNRYGYNYYASQASHSRSGKGVRNSMLMLPDEKDNQNKT